MKNSLRKITAILMLTLVLGLAPSLVSGQGRRHTISGYVKDAVTGEMMIGAVVNPVGATIGSVTNNYGFYSLELPDGEYRISYSSLGYLSDTVSVSLKENVRRDVPLKESSLSLQSSTVTATSKKDRLLRPETGIASLSGDFIKKVPVLFGETDIIKVIQLMPGVQSPSEGSTGFSVRGGGVDQNLILMDEASVYNAGHFLGFFSVFNNDAIKTADLYKGDIAPKYGGRLSSLLDVHTIDGNMQDFEGSLSLGLISSKILLQGPIVRDKASFMIAARRTYVDLFFPLVKNLKGDILHFYDINAKANWILNDNNRLYLSVFSGSDVFALKNSSLTDVDCTLRFANNTQSLRWNHVFSPKLFANFTILNSFYDFNTRVKFSATDVDFLSDLDNQSAKMDFNWFINPSNTVSFGVQGNYYTINPAELSPLTEGIFSEYVYNRSHAVSPDFYVQNEQKIGRGISLRYGVRVSNFYTLGQSTQRYYDENHQLKYSFDFDKYEIIKDFHAVEPRFSSSFKLGRSASIKASYNRNVQYIQQAIYSISGSPMDIWFTSSPNIKPQISDQYSVGVFKNFFNDAIETSVELFYKDNRNTIDFKDHPNIFMNTDLEAELRVGRSYAAGAEFLVKYEIKKLQGWVGYTYLDAKNIIEEINDGKPYDSPTSHKHEVTVVSTYNMTERLSASANWVYYSGAPTTFPVGMYVIGGATVPYYSGRNEDHFPDYHRLDISLTLQGKKVPVGERWHGEWNLSVYNVYSRHNAWALDFHYGDKNDRYSRMFYLFTAIPSVSYTLSF